MLERLLQGSFPEVDPGKEVLHVIPIGYHVDGLTGVRNPVGLHGNHVEVEAHVVLGDSGGAEKHGEGHRGRQNFGKEPCSAIAGVG